jgi:hypothetical protein
MRNFQVQRDTDSMQESKKVVLVQISDRQFWQVVDDVMWVYSTERQTQDRYTRGAQIPDTRSPWQLNFVQWHLVSVGSQYVTCFMSQFWHLEF